MPQIKRRVNFLGFSEQLDKVLIANPEGVFRLRDALIGLRRD